MASNQGTFQADARTWLLIVPRLPPSYKIPPRDSRPPRGPERALDRQPAFERRDGRPTAERLLCRLLLLPISFYRSIYLHIYIYMYVHLHLCMYIYIYIYSACQSHTPKMMVWVVSRSEVSGNLHNTQRPLARATLASSEGGLGAVGTTSLPPKVMWGTWHAKLIGV